MEPVLELLDSDDHSMFGWSKSPMMIEFKEVELSLFIQLTIAVILATELRGGM